MLSRRKKFEKMQQELVDYDDNFTTFGELLDQSEDSLNDLQLRLQSYQRSCQWTLKFSEQCQRAMETSDLDELIKFRDNLVKVNDDVSKNREPVRKILNSQ